MRQVCIKLKSGEKVLFYSEDERAVLQVRRLVHGAIDPLAASFKSSVQVSPEEAARIAAELLAFAGRASKV